MGEAHLGSFSFIFFIFKVAYSSDSGFQVISIALLAPTNLPKEGFDIGILGSRSKSFFSLITGVLDWVDWEEWKGGLKKKR